MSSARPRKTTKHVAPIARSISAQRDSPPSLHPIPVEIGAIEHPRKKRKAVEYQRDDVDNTPSSPAHQRLQPAESPAYALLALMASAQQSADKRSRPSESYTSWKAPSTPADRQITHTKKRKPTHTVRKQEISTLTGEIAQLEERLAFLRGHTLAPLTAASPHSSSSSVHKKHVDPEHPQIPNALLREAIHEQQLSLACARSMVSHFFMSDFALPAHCYIHLTTSLADRVSTLQAVKPQQLRVARRYVLERSRYLNSTKPHAAREQFLTESGDACHLGFSLEQFPPSVSVRQVFDAATFYTANLEISLTDDAGRLTIREDDDAINDPTLAHYRVLTTVAPDRQVEGHLAMFTHFDDDDDVGIVTSTFVDRDDLYPYRPRDRIRHDVTAALVISRENDCVVLRRLNHVRIHCNKNLPIPDTLAKAVSEGVSRWGEALVQHARQQCGLDES